MKKIIMIVGALLLSAGCLTAQDSPTQDTAARGYRSFFGSESTVWNAGLAIIDNPNLENKVLYIDGDTVINGVTYKTVYMRHRWGSSDSPSVGNDFVGVCREDTLNGRLWIKTPYILYWDMEEALIADMSLEMGDDRVDTTYYDSLGRKVIIYEYPDYPHLGPCRIVEGIGPEYVSSDHLQVLYLTCVYKNGIKEPFHSSRLREMFSHELSRIDYDNCWIEPSLSISDVTNGNCAVYPNPCHSFFEIELSEESQISMYDGLGHIILRKKVYSGKENIDITSLAAGCYYLNIANSDIFRWYKLIKK